MATITAATYGDRNLTKNDISVFCAFKDYPAEALADVEVQAVADAANVAYGDVVNSYHRLVRWGHLTGVPTP